MTRRPIQNEETTRRPLADELSTKDSFLFLLTILSHPDPRRIGERAALAELNRPFEGKAELGRHHPRFSPPGTSWNDRPLDDPYLSRKSWQIRSDEHGLELIRGQSSTDLVLDGESVDETAFVAHESLELGVTLELSGRIALLLHRLPQSLFAASEAEPPDRNMVGAAPGLLKVRSAVRRVADLGVPVLIRGESGTGKELVAQALHRQSRRAAKPFVAVDLGVLSPTLAAAELFGHAKGAFTGAGTAREGFFRAAEGGTLFLDEIGEATPEVQAMLLRVLETRQVVPVGSHRPISLNVRLIAATDSDLVARSRRGDFKEPLLHRLAAYVVELPPLRERREDIGRLFVHLARPVLRELGEDYRLNLPAKDGRPWLPPGLIARLARQSWTGNVRQLANVVRQLVIDSREEGRLNDDPQLLDALNLSAPPRPPVKSEHPLPPEPAFQEPNPTEPSEKLNDPTPVDPSNAQRPQRPSQLTDEQVEEAMAACDFEPAAAARHLGIGRPSLYKLVRRHPTLRLASDIPQQELQSALNSVDGQVADAAVLLCVSKRALGRRLTELGLHEKEKP